MNISNWNNNIVFEVFLPHQTGVFTQTAPPHYSLKLLIIKAKSITSPLHQTIPVGKP